ncbi:hypothetical protein CH291_05350 [Rhodococcus sp. 14-1411-2a]|nr:hypothetical protein CH291_05350 [Rhodococcus sp. 14-1411-2a]
MYNQAPHCSSPESNRTSERSGVFMLVPFFGTGCGWCLVPVIHIGLWSTRPRETGVHQLDVHNVARASGPGDRNPSRVCTERPNAAHIGRRLRLHDVRARLSVMATTASTIRIGLVEKLSARLSAIADELTELLSHTIPVVEQDHIDRDWLRVSNRANLEVVLHLVTNPADLDLAEPPVGALSIVHRLARLGVPLHEILRGYHLTESRWVQICVELLADLTDDVDVVVTEMVAMSTLAHTYTDRMCQRIAVEYETERERYRRQEEFVRLDRVMAVLDGTTVDLSAAEALLGYRLTRHHCAVIVWVDGPENTVDDFVRARDVVGVLADLAGCTSRPLVIPRGPATIWAWLPAPRIGHLDVQAVEKSLSAELPQLRVAIGGDGVGLDGFIASHRQAVDAHAVGSVADVSTVVPYQDVASLVFLCSDLARARRWIAETLGPLAIDGERERELRRTLDVYCSTNRSATATSRMLNCHKNTILYRLRTIERLLARPIDDGHLDLALALLACRWFGTAVFSTTNR